MKQESEIKAMLDEIRTSQTSEVSFDEAAILSEYQHSNGARSGLAIKVLIILGGFLATLALLGFLVIAKVFESEVSCLIFGVIFIAVSIGLNKVRSKLILDTFSITLFISGLLLIGVGFDQFDLNENILPLSFIVIGICSILISQRFILSFISILVINGSVIGLIEMHRQYPLIHVYIAFITSILLVWFLQEAKIISSGKKLSILYYPVRMGLTISFVAGLFLVGKDIFFQQAISNKWISSIFTISASLAVIYILCNILRVSQPKKILICLVSLLVLSPTVMMPAISGSLLIILLSFRVNYKVGLAIGMLSLIYFISQYYYDLNFTLLTKSYMLLATGVLFLLIYLFTYKKLQSHE